ncbi:MAG TPA: hypothetical protein VJ732_10465, partial [Bryobacteraceae bacterium]|nr:hypothetical protein [Bryobacteraceae bacterium]
MNGSEFSFRLAQVEPGSPEAAALAREIAEDARYPGRAAVANLLASEEDPAREKGKILLDGLGTFSLFPLAGSSRLADAATEVWLIRTLTEELAALRQRTGSALRPLLADRRPFPPPPPGAAPEPVPAPRVCDLVFLL